jgi:ribosome-binding ATPase YchF (GTP1/OBG family)
MSLSIGIVGLPNVGKSTLFNALLKEQQALAANYPFATIEPNVGIVPVPDARLEKLAEIVHTTTIKPATVEFVDIAGLVAGASKGEGLGNQFLANIRETAAICHVVRAFEDADIIREGSTDPKSDLEIIRLELVLADSATVEKQQQPKGAVDKATKERWEVIQAIKEVLDAGLTLTSILDTTGSTTTRPTTTTTTPAPSSFKISTMHQDQVRAVCKELSLMTSKKELFVINVSETQLSEGVDKLTTKFATELNLEPSQIIVMCNKIESELSSLADEDRALYLAELGLEQSGLDRLITAAYHTLHLQSYLTAGELEVRAWTIPQGCTARQAAGVIHTDFEKNFISARVTSYDHFVQFNGWKGVKENGKLRTESKDYVMQDGDVVEFMIGK